MRSILLLALLVPVCFPAAAAAGPKLFVFDCGALYLDDVAIFNLTPEETSVRELFVPCYLVEHEKGRLLWDGGLPKSWADQKGRTQIEGGSGEYETWIVDQLAAMKLRPADIDYAAYSHLHFDHAGAANYFLESTVLMQRAEWEAAFGPTQAFVDTSLYDELKNAKRKMLDGDHDVFGDGTVRLIFTPGHTPGHQALYVDLASTGPVILSGDLYHFRENRTLRRAPKFNFDEAMTLQSMDKVERLIEETGATLWIEHDKALADTLRKAPEFYP